MNFAKPPVVEVWISFAFEPRPTKTEWDLDAVGQYLARYSEELPRLEKLWETQFHVEETSASDLPRIIGSNEKLHFIRASDANKRRLLQIGDDVLAMHLVRQAEDYPRFSQVRDAITPKLLDYIDDFQPSSVRAGIIHYLDIIDIPVPDCGKIELPDYFPFASDLPEDPFGPTQFLAQQFVVNCPVDEGPLHLHMRNIPAPDGEKVFRFRLDWQKHSTGLNTLDLEAIWARLDRSHEYLRHCFDKFLKRQTLDLFQPRAEN